MPTITRIDGWRVVIYPGDHRPAHVHVTGPMGEVVFNLNCPKGPPVLRSANGVPGHVITGLQDRIATLLDTLCSQWRSIHGDY
jgi:hypothetical protein